MDVSLENLSSSQKDELMSTIKQKIAIANAQELVTVSFEPDRLSFCWTLIVAIVVIIFI